MNLQNLASYKELVKMTPHQAHMEVFKAVKEGQITRPDSCELCNIKGRTVGHHYNGWDKPLDIWHICYTCNSALRGRHDGSLTKEQAKEFITQQELGRRWRLIECYQTSPGERWRILFQGTEYQVRKKYQNKIQKRWRYGVALLDPMGEVVEIVRPK